MGNEESIYSELRDNLSSAVEKVNSYEFPRNTKATNQAILNSKFALVKQYRKEVQGYLENLYSLRNSAYASFLLSTVGVYYANLMRPKLEAAQRLKNLIDLLNSAEFSVALSSVKAALDSLNSGTGTEDDLHRAAAKFNAYISEYKEYMGYSDELPYMEFSLNKYSGDEPGADKFAPGILKFPSILKLATRDDKAIIVYENIQYQFRHYLENFANPYFECTINSNDLPISDLNMSLLMLNTSAEDALSADIGSIALSATDDVYLENGTKDYPYRLNNRNIDSLLGKLPDTETPYYFVIEGNITLSKAILPYGIYYAADSTMITAMFASTLKDLFRSPDDGKSYDSCFSSSISLNGSVSGTSNIVLTAFKGFSKNSSMDIVIEKSTKSDSLVKFSSNNADDTTGISTIDLTIYTTTAKEYKYSLSISFSTASTAFEISGVATLAESLAESSNIMIRALRYLCDLERLDSFSLKESAQGVDYSDFEANYSNLKFFTIAEYIGIINQFQGSLQTLIETIETSLSVQITVTKTVATDYTTTIEESTESSSTFSKIGDFISGVISGLGTLVSSLDSAGFGDLTSSTEGGDKDTHSKPDGTDTDSSGDHAGDSTETTTTTETDTSASESTETKTETTTTIEEIQSVLCDVEAINTKFVALLGDLEDSLAESIDVIRELAAKIDQYSPFYAVSTDYGNQLKTMLAIFYKNVNNSDTINFPLPSGIRSYEIWSQKMAAYTNDGVYNLALMYISQELGMTANEYVLNDDGSEFRQIFISAFNFAITDSINKKLWKNGVFSTRFTSIMNAQRILRDTYGISVVKAANFERSSQMIKSIITDIEEFDNIDISGIISGTTLVGSDEFNSLRNYMETIYLNWIFSNSDWRSAIQKLDNSFKRVGLNFRTILLKRFFEDTVIDIAANNESAKESLSSIIEGFTNSSGARSTDDIISKYQAVYYFLYDQENYMLMYFDTTEGGIGRVVYDFMVPGDIGETYMSTLIEKENTLIDKVEDKFKSLWNAISTAFSAICN